MIAEIPESITCEELDLDSPIKHFVPPAVTLSTTITSNAMAESENPPTPSASDDDSYEGSDVSNEPQEPRLTPDEPRTLFIDFYTFLTTLHYDNTCIEYVHYKSKLLDLTAFNLDDFEKHKNYHQDWEFWSSEGEQTDPSDVVCIAVGHESFSRELWLNAKDCEIFEDFHAGDMLDAVPVEDFFSSLKEQYQSLKLTPGKSRITIEAENVPEHGGEVKEQDVTDQIEEWGTDLEVQYVSQIYQDHGSTGSFDM
ncbi:uncharacterized protein FMAN_06243 [Fusarium mangiferae]|uniref:Uncharacterized protein n=1 Tax=Fusarium mangiferae TaxID=192010 RepID=A0A1L7STD3_FUSMA|nr:uncharacterized protein FMAN_06243 [Fusarium mangiferae]CVK86486.1 uncharacterized protein FMAN_06243 [Fusarium mangiferae]